MKQKANRLVAMLLCLAMLVCAMPFSALAAVEYDEIAESDYYKLISQKDWELAPGITESEIVLNNDAGDRRQVLHVVEVDMDNPYTKVIPSIKGMVPTAGNYGVQTMDAQAAYAEANGYGNVVAAMNISLSWYDSAYYDAHPELVGEPLGYMILDGVQYTNSQGQTSGAQTCLVINFDEKDGVARPADIPKVLIRSTSEAITGWEEQVIPANFGFLVKDGKMVHSTEEHTSEGASRSMLGVKADGSIIMVMNDGRQAPYSTGLNNYEMSEAMLKLGCVYAINGDGGGSSQFLSQRPGEEMEVHCSPSDGALRATTHGVLVITTAPSDGQFARASIETDNAYYTPGSTVEFKATGADLGGGAAEIPADATWQIKESGMGTITDGVFVSNGTVGTVTAQLVYEGKVVGEHSINIVVPDFIGFESSAYTIPSGKSVEMVVYAKYGVFDVALKAADYTITVADTTLGTLSGDVYSATVQNGSTTATVTLNGTELSATAALTIGKGSEVIFSFEEGTLGTDLSLWEIKDHEGKYPIWSDLSLVTAESGMVHNGEQALAMHMPMHSHIHGAEGYNANSITWKGDPILLENATAIGMWVYIPEEATQTEIALNYVWYNDSGVQQRTTPDLCLNDTFNGIEESGWYYLSVPIAKSVAYIEDATAVAASQGYKRNFFLKFYVTNSGNAGDESSYFGDITYYIDDITVDYSTAIDDRIAPVFSATYAENVDIADEDNVLTFDKVVTLNGTNYTFTAKVTDNIGIQSASAAVYVDGVKTSATYSNGFIYSEDMVLSAGVHRVVYEISDTNGNIARAVRYVEAANGTAAIEVVAHDPAATQALTGSVYYVDVVANNAEDVKSVTLKIDTDSMHEWELAYADLAEGFTASYYFATPAEKDDNVITLVLTNNGSKVAGKTVLASLPIRVWSFCGNGYTTDQTPAEAWTAGNVTAVSVNVEVEYGKVVFADDSSDTFSANKLHVDTEAYIHYYKMPADYKSANTFHVHTAEAMADKAATCTENGYSGRTFCAVCNSVAEWGTTATATGHDWQINAEGKLACANGGELFNGVYTDGKTYVDGAVIADGWNADNTAYYVDGVKLTGHQVMDGTMYTFSADGVYDADYQYNGLFDINGTVMYFVNNESQTGYQLVDGTGYYNFDENGYGFNGFVEINGTQCLFEKGVSVKTDEVLLAGICGEGVYYVIYADGRMVICGSGEMMDFTGLNHNPWWRQEYRFNIKSITIGKDITRIGMRAFIDTYATEVIFEEGSKLTEIFTHGFSLMDGLTEITIPDGVKTLGVQAFYNCPNLKDVYLPTSVTNIISNTFTGSPNALIHVAKGAPIIAKLEALGLSYVTYDAPLGSGSCGEATTWTLAGDGVLKISGTGAMDDYAAATAPWYAFRDSITAVEIGAEVTTVGKFSFFNCLKLKSVRFAENGALEAIGWGAFGYTGLENVTIPATVKTLNDYAFYNCAGLKTVAVAEGSIMNSIGRYAFWNDVALQSVFIPDGVSKINTGAFENTGAVKVSVAEGGFAHTYAVKNGIGYEVREAVPVQKYSGSCGENTTWSLWSNGVLKITGTGAMTEYAAAAAPWYAYRNEITSVEIGAEVTTVGKFSFFNCLKLKSVSFAENGELEAIGWGAFGYTGLESVTIPATVKTLNDYAFYQSKELKAVTFAENSALTSVGRYAFWNTTSLMEISGMPEGIKIGTNAFLDSSYPAE